MVERFLCASIGGTFNTEVYSFGNFLRAKKTFDKVLSKEGSAMAVKRILSYSALSCFKASKTTLAPTLYELIMQLKSAKVSPEDVAFASGGVDGILKNKLTDIAEVYSKYESFILNSGFEDQSSMLSYLPEVIESSEEIKGANVFVIGFSGFTAQIRGAIDKLIDTAASFTAVLTEGDNPLVFVNETAAFIRRHCKEKHLPMLEERLLSDYSAQGKLLVDNLFYPVGPTQPKNSKTKSLPEADGKVYYYPAPSAEKEIERVAEVIKGLVSSGECRYRDITLAVPNTADYGDYVRTHFAALDIPFFIDERKKPDNHPLITLILSYATAFIKNLERKALSAYFKNPIFCDDRELSDKFENYVIKYNVNYGKIKEPFKFSDGKEDLTALESFRVKVVSCFDRFDVRGLMEKLSAEQKIEEFTERLELAGEHTEAEVNKQVYTAVVKILDQMDMLLSDVKMSVREYKAVFSSGISALELSIIPQYNDAVFVGKYKEVALAKAKYLFAVGLTGAVPEVRADVSLLSDGDIDCLENLKVMIEPKIKVVNQRVRENFTLALSAFSDGLFLSYPVSAIDGKKNDRCEALDLCEKLFKLKPFVCGNGYMTEKQGVRTFARECGEFYDGTLSDFTLASSFYSAIDGGKAKSVLDRANKEIKVKLDDGAKVLIGKETSPTTIEDYYKCPYRAFLAHSVRLVRRDDGAVNALSVGNIMHDIFRYYAQNIGSVKDKESSDALFERVKDKVLERDEYKKYLADSATRSTVKRVLRESKKYCFNTYSTFKNSAFTVAKTEASFGVGKDYPPVPLLGGKVNLKGKIDRVDESDKYFRVMDYKTGTADATDTTLFAGLKLQLYLYAAAVQAKYADGEKKPAGLYYLPVSDKFEKPDSKVKPLAVGRTLNTEEAILAQDGNFFEQGQSEFLPVKTDKNGKVKNGSEKEQMSAFIDYAVSVSSLAVKRMEEGVIVPSPYQGTCDYCDYKALCGGVGIPRSVEKVSEKTFTDATQGGEEND